jgi:hypothetical protein
MYIHSVRTVGVGLGFAFGLASHGAAAQNNLALSNTARAVGDNRWDWTVFVQAPTQVLDRVKCVEYTLHPTFPNPVRRVCDRGAGPRAFALNSNGWGEFTIRAKVAFKDGHTQGVEYWLKLQETTPSVAQQGSTTNAGGCSVRVDFVIDEGSVRRIDGAPSRLLLYAEGVFEKGDSRFYLVSTTQPVSFLGDKLSPKEFAAALDRSGVQGATNGTLKPDTFLRLSARIGAPARFALPNGPVTLNVLNPRDHGTVYIDFCAVQERKK